MIGAIRKRIADILYADLTLMAAGSAYATGWPGVTHERTNTAKDGSGNPISVVIPAKGYVNLFDRSYSKDADTARPAIYMGTMAVDAVDSLEFTAIAGLNYVEYRQCMIPLMIVATHQDWYTAESQRDQLRFNIRQILRKHLTDALWYKMAAPGVRGGGEIQEKNWTSGTGQQVQGNVESMCYMPIVVSYQFSDFSTNA